MKSENYLIYGGMGLGGSWENDSKISQKQFDIGFKAIDTIIENGINYIDFADIYRQGTSEKLMGEYLKKHPSLRSKLIIQSKVGIRLNQTPTGTTYDFSYEHILRSVEGILERLNTDYLDYLLLHRPDPLMDQTQLNEAISKLFKDGKIRNLGVSNMNQHQIQLIESYTGKKVRINQLELSLSNSDFVYHQLSFNNNSISSSNYHAGTTEFCMLNDIEIQAWSPLSQGIYTGRSVSSPSLETVNTINLVKKLSGEYGVSKEAIVLAWLMRHPASIKPVIGSTNPDRIKACAEALSINLDHDHWYELLVTARGIPLP